MVQKHNYQEKEPEVVSGGGDDDDNLQSETVSLSGGDYSWLKRKSTRKKIPVTYYKKSSK